MHRYGKLAGMRVLLTLFLLLPALVRADEAARAWGHPLDRKSTRLNSSH